MMGKWRGVIAEFRQFLPVTDKTPIITMGEGNTPLVFAGKLAKEIGFKGQLHLKYEGANPTGSFKDRGMVVAVAKALEDGKEMLMCASTGNTASSAAAYGAVAGLPVAVIVPKGGVAPGKLTQINMYGAKLVTINGSFDVCQDIVRALVEKHPKIGILNSINPYRLEGQKIAAFEIWEELGGAPDYHFIPVGNAGNITAYWMGYKEWQVHALEQQRIRLNYVMAEGEGYFLTKEEKQEEINEYFADQNAKRSFYLPKMMGYQAEGAAPIVRRKKVKNPQTIASAIRIGNPARWKEAVEAVSESGGKFDTVTDGEILYFHGLIPKLCPEVACEPASAASVAGLAKAVRLGKIENNEDTVVVCTLTGAFWKDLAAFKKGAGAGKIRRSRALNPDLATVERFLKL